jgi:hypothetical protein
VYLLSLVFVSLRIKHWDTPALPFTHEFLRHPGLIIALLGLEFLIR